MIRIKDLRKQNHMTQAELGAYLGVANTTISMYETEQRMIGPDTIRRLCALFGCTADYLLGISNDEKPLVSKEDSAFLKAYHTAREKDRLVVDTILSEYM